MFSDDPRLGFLAQRDRYQTALEAGELLPPAKNIDDMSTIVTNATVNASLGFLFGALVVIVLLDATRVCIQSIRTQRAGGVVETTETPHVPSQIVAPAGFLPTAREKQLIAAAGARDGGGSGGHPGGSVRRR